MKVFALTGGIACGKSTVVDQLKKQENFVVFDSDEITRILQEPGQEGFVAIKKKWPSVITSSTVSGAEKIDRQRLADIVFEPTANGDAQRKILNGIMQPLIAKFILVGIFKIWLAGGDGGFFGSNDKIVIVDAPVLLEMEQKLGRWLVRAPFASVIVVSTSEDVQLQRLVARGDGCSEAEAKRRIAAQLSLKEKERLADFVVRNDGSVQDLNKEVVKLVDTLRRQSDGLFVGWNRLMIVAGGVVALFAFGTYWAVTKIL